MLDADDDVVGDDRDVVCEEYMDVDCGESGE